MEVSISIFLIVLRKAAALNSSSIYRLGPVDVSILKPDLGEQMARSPIDCCTKCGEIRRCMTTNHNRFTKVCQLSRLASRELDVTPDAKAGRLYSKCKYSVREAKHKRCLQGVCGRHA
jgi:hypothetical protein